MGTPALTRVEIIGGYPALRAGLRSLLATFPDFEVTERTPDEGRMPTADPPQVLLCVGPLPVGQPSVDAPAVIMVRDADEGFASHSSAMGPVSLVLRDAEPDQLAAALRAAAAGLVVIPPALFSLLGRDRPAGPPRGDATEDLTDREREVLALVADGLPSKAIGARLGISENTVKFHVGAILGKLGAASRAEAVMIAARRGLLAL